jgi:Zn-dependent protease with chaperone function
MEMATMTDYPAGPTDVPPDLTQPSPAYRRHAYLAVAGLAVFIAAYLGLTAWFAWAAVRMWRQIGVTGNGWWWVGAAATAFLALFMVKALVFVRRGGGGAEIEVTAASHPRLYAFLLQVAADAKAPRPHRVFLSPAVNAAVFYDLTVFNLLFPSRKNLVIGLGLINVLNLSELKAVLAHEFGHFAQRSMAVGRWVYTAQQIAAHIVEKRDVLDRFLRGVSNFDLRVAWIGWILRTIVWAIRALVDTVFSIVILAERALSREMELQADLVAVSLTGSDPLIHALHRLGAADDALDRALAFTGGQQRAGKRVEDLFAIQTEMIARKRHILADPTWGEVPAPVGAASEQRLFKAQLAQPAADVVDPPAEHGARGQRQAPVRRGADRWPQRLDAVRRSGADAPRGHGVAVPRRRQADAAGADGRDPGEAGRALRAPLRSIRRTAASYLDRVVTRAVARPARCSRPRVPRDRAALIARSARSTRPSLSAAIERGRRARDRGGDAARDRARRRRGAGRAPPLPRPRVPAPRSADLDPSRSSAS